MNIQINNIHSTNSLSIIKALSRIEKYDIIVIGSDIYKKGECAGSLLVDKYYQAPPITQEAEYINFLNDVNEKENVDLLIPASDAEAVLLSKYINQVKTKFFLYIVFSNTSMVCKGIVLGSMIGSRNLICNLLNGFWLIISLYSR